MDNVKMYCGENVLGEFVCCYGEYEKKYAEAYENGKRISKLISEYFIRKGDVPKEKWAKKAGEYDIT